MYTVIIECDPDTGTYAVTAPDLPDVLAVGETEADALARFRNAATGYIGFLRETGRDVPPPRHTVTTVQLTA